MIQFQAAPGALPEGRRVYAIGDIHGCLTQLVALHAAIAEDLATRPCPAPLLIHLGDYIDRGPASAAVLTRLAAGDPVGGMATVNLMGNHERTMLEAVTGDGAAATDWMIGGGDATLQSWGIAPGVPRAEWAHAVPADHLAFVHQLALTHREGGYLFVHAGLRPGVPIADQTSRDLLSIRLPFLYSEADFGVVVVHGHTPKPTPVIRHNRIGIDTGAVFDGRLTCAVLEGMQVGFLQR